MDLEEFRRYRPGDILDIHWDRGNGELDRDYVLCGFENGMPLLVYSNAISDGNPSFFDVKHLERYVLAVEQADLKPVDLKIVSKILQCKRMN